jgi:RNA polymerase-binding transcription factor DksA
VKSKPQKSKTPARETSSTGASKGLSKAELAEFKALLTRRRRVLSGDVETLEGEACKKGADAAGDLSTLPMHLADLGTDSFEQDISLGLMENESDEIREIEEALERIKDGSFGLCETCKKRIPKERLKAIPYARLCVNCKKKEEGV